MKFEIHLTLNSYSKELSNFAKQLNIKTLIIELDKGDTPIQPMLTVYGEGQLVDQFMKIDYLTNKIEKELDCKVVRAKIETPLNYEGILYNGTLPIVYYEQHLKFRLSENDIKYIKLAIDNAHLSKNALKKFEDGSQDRFVTLRCSKDLTPIGAYQTFFEFKHILGGYNLLKEETEIVVYDSNVNLDKGWI